MKLLYARLRSAFLLQFPDELDSVADTASVSVICSLFSVLLRRYDYRSWTYTFGTLFRVLVGQFSFQFEGATYEYSAQVMFALYLVCVLILLLNLLIAVLSAEQSKVYEDVDKEYNLFYARLVLKLKRFVSTEF